MTLSLVRPLAAGLATVFLFGCGSSDSPSSPAAPQVNAVAQPTTINLYPNESSQNPARLTVMITKVGSQAVSTAGSVINGALFDSGTPDMEIRPPTGGAFPSVVAPGTSVLVTTPSGFSYAYLAGSGTTATAVDPATSTADSIIGIAFFTTNSLFIDFTSSIEGWR